MIKSTEGSESVAFTNGDTNEEIILCTLIPQNIVIVATINNTIAVGVNASNERATEEGT